MRTHLRNANPRLIYFSISAPDCAGMVAKLDSRGMAGWYQPRTEVKTTERNRAISEVTLVNTPEIHLPRWVDVRRAPPGSDKVWKKFVDIVHRHEKGHHQHFTTVLEGLKREYEARDTLTQREVIQMWNDGMRKNRRLSQQYHANAGNTRAGWKLLERGP